MEGEGGRETERGMERAKGEGEEEGERFYSLKICLSWPMVNEHSHCVIGKQ